VRSAWNESSVSVPVELLIEEPADRSRPSSQREFGRHDDRADATRCARAYFPRETSWLAVETAIENG
jgi:hypothetical protein